MFLIYVFLFKINKLFKEFINFIQKYLQQQLIIFLCYSLKFFKNNKIQFLGVIQNGDYDSGFYGSGTVTTFKKLEESGAIPPTYLKTTDFLDPFQSIVSTYGIASYEEVNPAFFTTVTFPFLFGVMFGDVCHGLALFGVSLVLCLAKDRLIKSKSMLAPLVGARYLFLLMGFFATFCGLIYNDFAGMNLNFFPTCYRVKLDYEGELEVERQEGCVSPFGFDHFWRYSHKDLIFVNSFKMKISMIIAVLHMSLGVFMKLVNSVHFKEWIDVIFEFIPQIIFLLALFGYMDCLIVIKWLTHFEDTSKASSIISAVINLFLGMGNVTDKEEICNE